MLEKKEGVIFDSKKAAHTPGSMGHTRRFIDFPLPARFLSQTSNKDSNPVI